jgi:hypothetical protein
MRWLSLGLLTSWQWQTDYCQGLHKARCLRFRRNLPARNQPQTQRRNQKLVLQEDEEEEGNLALNRRQFLRRGAIAVAGVGLVRPNLVTTATAIFTRGPAKKVVILGAGMAGLVAGMNCRNWAMT